MTSYIYRASAIVAAISALLVFTSVDSTANQSEFEAIAAQSPNQTFARRTLPQKPVWTRVHGGHRRDSINLKLLDSSQLSLSGHVFTSASPGDAVHASDLMSILQGTTIEMLTDADPERLKHERTTAMANLGREIADISKWYSVEVPAGTDIELLINKLNELSIVEIAVPVPLGAPPPSCTMSVNCQADQVYLGVQGPSEGINATAVWSQLGANGQGVRVTNIEETYGTHSDLPTITNLNGHPAGDTAKRNHGTNTFGILGSKHNSLGTRGIAYGATHYFASSVTTSTPICTQLAQSRNAMQPGDVILIEKQIWVDGNQTIRGPVEHHQPN